MKLVNSILRGKLSIYLSLKYKPDKPRFDKIFLLHKLIYIYYYSNKQKESSANSSIRNIKDFLILNSKGKFSKTR